MEPALRLLIQVQCEAQAGTINPTRTDLTQPPYSPLLGQGVCDLRQACGVGDVSKTVSFLRKADSCLARVTSYILVIVQDHLGVEGGAR
jgi:hypothetical protein